MTYIEPIDNGARCLNHAGEAFPVRCVACNEAAAEWEASRPKVCPQHPMHLRPCDKCEAVAAQFETAVHA